MPAPTTVSDEAIIEAGHQLARQGKRVTGWTLKTVLGTGRPSRLQEIWTVHAAQVAEQVRMPPASPLPAPLEQQVATMQVHMAGEVDSLISAVWQTAERIAVERTKTEVDAARDATACATADLDAAEQAIADAEAERDQALAAAVQLHHDLRDARAEADRQRGHAEAANAQTQRAEAAAAAAMETVRVGAEERGRLLERVERAEAEAQAQTRKRSEKTAA